MWSSSGVNNISSSKAISSSLLSTSSSTWTASSSTIPSPSSPIPSTARKSMEEVWEDISLSSLHHHTTTTASAAHSGPFNGMTLQDFLARSLDKYPPTRDDYDYDRQQSSAFVASRAPPRPTTVLSLNSEPEFHHLQSTDHLRSNPQVNNHGCAGVPTFWSPLNSLASSAAVFSSFSKKRPPEKDDNSRDRKDMRLIKNRDSADRSRARKQAYINELEQEVAHLGEENAKLRKQLLKEDIYKTSCLAVPTQLPKKESLCRSLTAPF